MKIASMTEQLFWSIVWVFVILIIGFFLLKLLGGIGGPVGNIADWVAGHAEPQN